MVLADELAAPPLLFAISLVVCLVAFAYVVTVTLVTSAYSSARGEPGPSEFFDGWNPLKRMVIGEMVTGD